MSTRRHVITLLATVPFLTRVAHAQTPAPVSDLFKSASDRVRNPAFVRAQFAVLSYYVELLQSSPPEDGEFKFDETRATVDRLRAAIDKNDAKINTAIPNNVLDNLAAEYAKHRNPFFAYLKQVGIVPESPASFRLETAISSLMVFYAGVTGVKDVAAMAWCIFPFCVGR